MSEIEPYIRQLLRTPSSTEWIRFAGILLGICGTIGIGEGVRFALRWSPEFTRKLIHISVAILIFFAPRLFTTALPAIILAVLFTLVAYIAIKLGLLKSLHSVSHGAYGTVYYPIAFLVLVFLFWNTHSEIVSLSMLVLGLGDAFAAIVGESIKKPIIFNLTSDKKSIQGSLAMFTMTMVGLIAGLTYFDGTKYPQQTIFIAVICSSLIATACEALSSRALDNLTIPLSVAFVLHYMLVPSTMQNIPQFAIGVALGIFIAFGAFYARFLTASGSVATFLLASLVYGVGGWKWTVPILVFFVLSSFLSLIGKRNKKEFEVAFEKSGRRDYGQVAANGGVAGVVIVLQYVFQDIDLYPVYLGAVAAVTADTWGTEIGTFFKGRTVSIVGFDMVRPGTNGGISIAGLLGGLAGSATIALSAYPWASTGITMAFVTSAGIIGTLTDSLIGSTLQARYFCKHCGKTTERQSHCNETTEFTGGVRWLNNDGVNWLCALSGALVVLILAVGKCFAYATVSNADL